MLKKRLLCAALCLWLALFSAVAYAHEDQEHGHVRMVQIFYGSADIYVDDVLTFSTVAFTVGTDFIPLEPGSHTIAFSPADAGLESSIPTVIEVVAGHDYTILTMGIYESGIPDLIIIDETTTFAEADEQSNKAIIVQNLPGAIPVDVWFLDELKIENLEFGGYGTAVAPIGEFSARAVVAGDPNTVLFESQYFAVPATTSLAYLSGNYPDGINRTFFTTTDANTYEYLTAHAGVANSKLTTFYELLTLAGLDTLLSGETQYTIFAPTNAAFEALPEGTLDALRADPEALLNVLSYHIVEGRFGPYELTGEHSLTSLQGAALEVVFQPITVPLTVNEVVTGLQHRTANGVIYLIDTVLTLPE